MDDPAVARWAGAVTAQEARAVGINWVFAPVADLDLLPDNPIVQTRSFGGDPQRVATLVRSWIEGCQGAGALACAKHYPGHGRTTADSHITLPAVDASREVLTGSDLVPFAVAADCGVAAMMTAHVAFPALDPSGLPATLSSRIMGELRTTLGFQGLVVTDALIMDGALVGRRESDAAVEAVQSGVDLLLYPKDPRRVRDALASAAESGALSRERIAEALGRYERALAAATRSTPPVRRGPYESADDLADALLRQGMLRGDPPSLTGPLDLVIVDDDLGGPYPPGPSDHVGTSAGERAGEPLHRRLARRAGLLGAAGVEGSGGIRTSRRATRSASYGSDAELIVLFGHPRLAEELRTSAPVLLAWHRQRLMQEAVGRWLGSRLSPSPPRS